MKNGYLLLGLLLLVGVVLILRMNNNDKSYMLKSDSLTCSSIQSAQQINIALLNPTPLGNALVTMGDSNHTGNVFTGTLTAGPYGLLPTGKEYFRFTGSDVTRCKKEPDAGIFFTFTLDGHQYIFRQTWT